MLNKRPGTIFTAQLRILFCIVLFEFVLFIFSGVSFSFLHGDPFFSLGADPASWIVYGLNIPQFIIGHQWAGLSLDALTILLLLLLIRNPFNNKVALGLLILLFLFYISLMGYLTHRNYQFGFFVVFIPFIFRKDIDKFFAFEGIRYFLLFFYFSAAFLKLSNNSLADPAHFSHMLSTQFTPYFVEANTGLRTSINLYFINHIQVSFALYLSSFLIELIVIAGFFTKRFDKWLAILVLAFHFMSWLIMDIAPFGQAGFICLLFFSKSFKSNFAGKNESH
ncbi:MAG: hypothetical protein ABI402_09435 [Ferruginibacter sp.]